MCRMCRTRFSASQKNVIERKVDRSDVSKDEERFLDREENARVCRRC